MSATTRSRLISELQEAIAERNAARAAVDKARDEVAEAKRVWRELTLKEGEAVAKLEEIEHELLTGKSRYPLLNGAEEPCTSA